jgi:CheY-like chemotaxis protein
LVLGAQLDCHSAPEQGSIFWFEVTFPSAIVDVRSTVAEPLAGQAADVGQETAAALRMLIVDDHPTNRKVLELLLDQLGADWVSVENGQEAVEAVAAQVFDVILMDIQMPVMDGITATREIRGLERAAGRTAAPVIIVSANGQPEHVQAGQAAGAQRHLAKPVNAQALIDALSEVLADDPATEQQVA